MPQRCMSSSRFVGIYSEAARTAKLERGGTMTTATVKNTTSAASPSTGRLRFFASVTLVSTPRTWKPAGVSISTYSAFLLLNPPARATSAATPAIITRSPCSRKRNSTSANTPAITPNISGKKTTSTKSPGRSRASPRWPAQPNIFMTSASRSCARGALVAAVRNFTSTSGRRTNKSSNFIMASSRSAGTATPAQSPCAMALR